MMAKRLRMPSDQFRLRKAWQVTIAGCDFSSIVYAPSQGKARMDAWHRWDSAVRIVDIKVRRAADQDISLPEKDPIADRLSEQAVHCLLHSFGADQRDPNKAGYRDYFYTTRDDPPLVELHLHGLMEPMPGDKWGEGMTYFVLTDAGKRVALSLVPEYTT